MNNPQRVLPSRDLLNFPFCLCCPDIRVGAALAAETVIIHFHCCLAFSQTEQVDVGVSLLKFCFYVHGFERLCFFPNGLTGKKIMTFNGIVGLLKLSPLTVCPLPRSACIC